MRQKANYNYIKWLPENRMVVATQQALLATSYITNLFGKNVFGYSKDDSATYILPSLRVDSGRINSSDNYSRVEGELLIDIYFGMDLIREHTTEIIETATATLRWVIQNNNFATAIALNMFTYNETISTLKNGIDKQNFENIMGAQNPLLRYGIDYEAKPATSIQLDSPKVDCYKSSISFKYWVGLQDYFAVLEVLGVNCQFNPNQIVYPQWETFSTFVE